MSRLSRCHNIADLRSAGLRRLPLVVREFLEGGSDDEWSLRNNREAFARHTLVPRPLVDVSRIDMSTTLLGQEVDWPVVLAPTGMSRLYHAAGELAVARAAAGTGTLYSLSTYSSQSLEEVSAATAAPKMFQLFTSPGLEQSFELIERARAAGYQVLCLTVDTTAPPNKERDVRTGLERGGLSLASLLSILAHPRWVAGLVGRGALELANLGVPVTKAREHQWREADRLSWEIAQRIRERWRGPLALKGMMGLRDAERAAAIGVDAIILSNHGGRQLDSLPAPIDRVADFVDAVGDRVEILMDSGIRRGTDVLKALALGASGCLVGRPYLYGLAAGGEAGVVRAIEILKAEIERDMKLLGAPDVAVLDRSFIWSR
jgi:L-lactate dehydrogenase (cytochrome)